MDKEKSSLHTELREKEISDWTVSDVCNWIRIIGCGDYAHHFEKMGGISGDILLDLNKKDLEQIGLRYLGLQKRILKKIKYLKEGRKEAFIDNFTVTYLRDKGVSNWSISDVCDWLSIIGLDNYNDIFKKEKITGEKLLILKKEMLESIGITLVGPQKRLIKKIEYLKENKEEAYSYRNSKINV